MIRTTILSAILFWLAISQLGAQPPRGAYNKYWVQFRDKNNTPYSVLRPEAFLSARSLERRARQGILPDWSDLPVVPAYVEELRNSRARVLFVSRWLNGAVVWAEPDTLRQIAALPFVSGTRAIGYLAKPSPVKTPKKIAPDADYPREQNFYGKSFVQVNQLFGEALHGIGHRGKPTLAAIFDGGFLNVHVMPAFDSLFRRGQLLGTHDFVEGDEYVFEASNHGTNVLSCMAALIPGVVVGTGPEASFYLFKTEDVGAELVQEEYNWLAAAELADSLGVEVINSSLGYTAYDDSTMSYRYRDLTGDRAVISRAADLAAAKGILVVNSAGNSGRDAWHYVGTPADADSILSVGAVDRSGVKAGFSSFGPTPDGRIKPNVAARGAATAVAELNGYGAGSANGTSFSSPVMAGMVAALWGAVPENGAQDIIRALEAAGNQAEAPNDGLGYGIPNVAKAFVRLAGRGCVLDERSAQWAPGLADASFELFWRADADETVFLELYRNASEKISADSMFVQKGFSVGHRFDLDGLSDGCYTAVLRQNERTRRVLFFRKKGASFVSDRFSE
jgi:serine protease AprX